MLTRLRAIPDLDVREGAILAPYTRFGLGGRALALADARTELGLTEALRVLKGCPWTLIGGGSNLVVADEGFEGVVLRYTANRIGIKGNQVDADAGVVLQDLVNVTVDAGLQGLETMTGIPGWLGGAVYGNAGAYGHSIDERVQSVRFFDGDQIREISGTECQFRYRESIFKARKGWVITGARLHLNSADASKLKETAEGILKIRNEKYPPTMRCAGSIFKNLLLKDLPATAPVPERVVREGKVPSAYFLEQVGAKGMILGGIKVAEYHANLLYNEGRGTASEVCQLIEILKDRVFQSYGLILEEEVQYVGGPARLR
jgi:UDP-N-acetylmuramate dehydrogenase